MDAVCFDLGGVMIKIRHTWGEVLDGLGLVPETPRADYGRLVDFPGLDAYQAGSMSFEEYLNGLGTYLGGLSRADAARVHGHILWEEYPGSLALVEELKGLGMRVGCLSNTNATHLEECMDSGRFPVCRAFDRLVTSFELGLNKPDAAIYRAFERELGVPGGGVVFFDDAVANVEGARAVGWEAFLVDPEGDVDGQLREGLRTVGVLV